MNLENPTSIISSATNTVAQITSLAAEKLGPITTKTIEVVSRQVIVEAVTLLLACILAGVICFFAIKSARCFNSKITDSSSRREDSLNETFESVSWAVAVVSMLLFVGTLIASIKTLPTAIFNTEYATAEKFVEIFQKIKP